MRKTKYLKKKRGVLERKKQAKGKRCCSSRSLVVMAIHWKTFTVDASSDGVGPGDS